MTAAERRKMYEDKRRFVAAVANAFADNPGGHSVHNVTYEAWGKPINGGDPANGIIREWVIVHFPGGAISPRPVSCNSNAANFRAIAEMIDGGYYSCLTEYLSLPSDGFVKIC